MKNSSKLGVGGVLLSLSIFVLGVYYPLANKSNEIETLETSGANISKGKVPKKYSEAAWANVGAGGYTAAARWMAANNKNMRKLDERQKRYLRPHFGDLVDRVEVIYDATLPDELVAASFRLDFGKSSGQVYGHKIYLSSPYKPGDNRQLVLLSHELVHVRQYEQLGSSLDRFGYKYFKEYERAGQKYKSNKMEQEAFAFERQFAQWLVQELANYPDD